MVFNRFFQFFGLWKIYLETFPMSKFFIVFRSEKIFRSFWHGFCRASVDGRNRA